MKEQGADVWKKLYGNYSERFLDHAYEPRNVGIIYEPDVNVFFTGPCGDTMQISIRASGRRIEEIKFLADGCEATTACGSAITEMVSGKTIAEAASIGAASIKKYLGGLPSDHEHCAILAAGTLRQALAELIHKSQDGQGE
jgi:nitrogen fixation protein NifU and related proteins